jgi:1-acyl-sn-glycerol-3-phosphate acyltransferase
MGEFEAIRPYADHEVAGVIDRLLADPAFISVITRFRFPHHVDRFGWILKPLVKMRLRHKFGSARTVDALQLKIEPYIDRTIDNGTDGVTYSGVDRLNPQSPYLFLANHRDIVMDPAFVNFAVFHGGLQTPRIAIGDNLLQKPFVSDLMRVNKSFIVRRSLPSRKEKLAAYQLLSAYINHSLRVDGASIWIAQAEGRAKDGDDRTDSAILKMFHMSRKEESFAELAQALRIVPVCISYEYDPCDLAKARELYIRATTGTYTKAPGEDDTSIALGITGYKGRVHIAFCDRIDGDFPDAKLLAQEVDRRILANYRLFPINYFAYSVWDSQDPEITVPAAETLFSAEELSKARMEWQRRLDACPLEQRPYLVLQYATPVRNHYRVQANLPL